MYNKLLIATFMVILVALAIYIPTHALTGYHYSQRVTVSNTSAASVTSRVEIAANPLALVNGTFVQADADDVAITYNDVQQQMMAFDLGNNGVDWVTQEFTIPANTSYNYYLWYSNPDATRDQNWLGATGDTQVVTDHASLDITTNLTLRADVYLDALPVGTEEIISKDLAYRLTVDAANFNMSVYVAGVPTTATIAATTDQWVSLVGTYDGANVSITDGISSNSNPLVAVIDVNASDVEVGEFAVWLDDVRIGDTAIAAPTWKLYLQYEPDQMTSAAITDQSASSNDAAYTLSAMSGSFSVAVDSMTATEESDVPSVEQNAVGPAGYQINQPSNWSGNDGVANPGADTIPSQVMQPLIDTSGLDAKWVWWFAFGVLNVLIFIASMKILGLHIAIGWIASLICTALFVMYGPIPWWFLAFYGIGLINVFTAERSPQL